MAEASTAPARWVLRGLNGEPLATLSIDGRSVRLDRRGFFEQEHVALLLSEVRGVSLRRIHYPWLLVLAVLSFAAMVWDLFHQPTPSLEVDGNLYATLNEGQRYARFFAAKVGAVVSGVTGYLATRKVIAEVHGDDRSLRVEVPGDRGDLVDGRDMLEAIEALALRERATTRRRARSGFAAAVAALGAPRLPGTLDSARSPMRNGRVVAGSVGLASALVGASITAFAAPRRPPPPRPAEAVAPESRPAPVAPPSPIAAPPSPAPAVAVTSEPVREGTFGTLREALGPGVLDESRKIDEDINGDGRVDALLDGPHGAIAARNSPEGWTARAIRANREGRSTWGSILRADGPYFVLETVGTDSVGGCSRVKAYQVLVADASWILRPVFSGIADCEDAWTFTLGEGGSVDVGPTSGRPMHLVWRESDRVLIAETPPRRGHGRHARHRRAHHHH